MPDTEHDPVNHPTHYTNHPSGVEVIELTRLLPFGPGNAVKYVLRRGLKGDERQDLEKALWYINDSFVHEIGINDTPEVRALAEKIIAAEPNELVQKFLDALCLKDFTGHVGYPAYGVAGATIALLLRGHETVPEPVLLPRGHDEFPAVEDSP